MSLLQARQVAEKLNISTFTAYELMRRGELPVIRVGPRLVRVREEDLRRFIERQRRKQGEAAAD